MKRLFILVVLICLLLSLRAQSGDNGTAVAGNYLSQGDNIFSLNTRFSGSVGKNKFDDGNTRKPADFGVDLGVSWETMINDTWALGAFAEYDVDIQKDKESDTKNVLNTLVFGPQATAYKPCGELENGGVFGMVMLGGGIQTNSYSFADEKDKDPVSGILAGQLDFGGYYMLGDNWMLTGSIAMFGFETEFMNMDDEFSSTPDMVQTDWKFGIRDFIPKLGVRYICGGKDDDVIIR